MNVAQSVCRTVKFRANFKQNLFQKLIRYLKPIIKLVFHAKILARFQFGLFWLCRSTQYRVSKIEFSPFFRGLQTLLITTIFEEILQIILFHENKSACHIIGKIWDSIRIPNLAPLLSLTLSLSIYKYVC